MKNRLIIGIITAAVLVAAVIYLVAGTGGPSAHVIALPSPTVGDGGAGGGEGVSGLDITPETLKTALESLSRSDSFSRGYLVKTYWEGGETEVTVKHWSRDGKTKLVLSRDSETKNILILGDTVYIWYDGDKKAMEAKLSGDDVQREIDRFAGLLTYEDIFALPQRSILDAGYAERAGQSCTYAKYRHGSFDYVSEVYISNDSGLLVSSATYDGERLVNSMELLTSIPSAPEDELFQLPF